MEPDLLLVVYSDDDLLESVSSGQFTGHLSPSSTDLSGPCKVGHFESLGPQSG